MFHSVRVRCGHSGHHGPRQPEVWVGDLQIVVYAGARAWQGDARRSAQPYLPSFNKCISCALRKPVVTIWTCFCKSLFIHQWKENFLWLDPFRDWTVRLYCQEQLSRYRDPWHMRASGRRHLSQGAWGSAELVWCPERFFFPSWLCSPAVLLMSQEVPRSSAFPAGVILPKWHSNDYCDDDPMELFQRTLAPSGR